MCGKQSVERGAFGNRAIRDQRVAPALAVSSFRELVGVAYGSGLTAKLPVIQSVRRKAQKQICQAPRPYARFQAASISRSMTGLGGILPVWLRRIRPKGGPCVGNRPALGPVQDRRSGSIHTTYLFRELE